MRTENKKIEFLAVNVYFFIFFILIFFKAME